MKYIKKCIFFIKEIFLGILGISICIYFFYIRVILERLPRKLEFAWNSYLFLLYLTIFLCFCYLLKKILYPKENKNKMIIWLKENFILRIIKIYDEALHKVYMLVIDSNFQFRIILQKSIYFLHTCCKTRFIKKTYIFRLVYYTIVLLPRIIVANAFFIDVVIFNEFYYLYKICWILIIPLMWKISYYLIKEHFYTQSIVMNLYLNIQIITDKEIIRNIYHSNSDYLIIKEIDADAAMQKEHPLSIETRNSMMDDANIFYIVYLCYISMFSNESKHIFNSKIYTYLQTYRYILYAVGWGYMALKLFLDLFFYF